MTDNNIIRYGAIPGFSSIQQRLIVNFVLKFIQPTNSLEIGAWHGRTSLQLVNETSSNVVLIDCVEQMLEETRKHIDAFYENPNVTYINSNSYDFNYLQYYKLIDFIHIDGEHAKSAVLNDLAISKEMITTKGIICIDDFFSYKYPQVTEGVYDWLNQNKDYKLILVGFEKAFICHTKYFTDYAKRIIDNIENYFIDNNFKDYHICKTSPIADSFTYSIMTSSKQMGIDYLNSDHIETIQ